MEIIGLDEQDKNLGWHSLLDVLKTKTEENKLNYKNLLCRYKNLGEDEINSKQIIHQNSTKIKSMQANKKIQNDNILKIENSFNIFRLEHSKLLEEYKNLEENNKSLQNSLLSEKLTNKMLEIQINEIINRKETSE